MGRMLLRNSRYNVIQISLPKSSVGEMSARPLEQLNLLLGKLSLLLLDLSLELLLELPRRPKWRPGLLVELQ